jgi:integration host factor subunit alpha
MRVGGAMALTKNDIVTAIHEIGFTKKKSVEIIESLLEIIKQRLESGEDVLISGFGKFCVKEKKARRGRNPATGSDLVLRARRIVTFKCSGKLRNKINAES